MGKDQAERKQQGSGDIRFDARPMARETARLRGKDIVMGEREATATATASVIAREKKSRELSREHTGNTGKTGRASSSGQVWWRTGGWPHFQGCSHG
jgi:hypothetical protein